MGKIARRSFPLRRELETCFCDRTSELELLFDLTLQQIAGREEFAADNISFWQ
ncbi:hypothetical protein [Stanieria cyanosphaera]|uniref:hypothetical protein n=1 Tax=Stanieria cyanosphaera TaxID=102116 RepID=UPI0014943FBE|nr:hypothetical protein [Stanieria cyanosphaera]